MNESLQANVKQQEFIKPGEGSNININSTKQKQHLSWNHRETAEELNYFKLV